MWKFKYSITQIAVKKLTCALSHQHLEANTFLRHLNLAASSVYTPLHSHTRAWGYNYITLGSKGLLSTNLTTCAMSLDTHTQRCREKHTGSTKERSFTAELWTNWTLREEKFKGKAEVKCRGCRPVSHKHTYVFQTDKHLIHMHHIYHTCISYLVCCIHTDLTYETKPSANSAEQHSSL